MQTDQVTQTFYKQATSSLQLEASDISKLVRIGVIGCGRIGQLHIDNINSRIANAQVVCVSDFIPNAAIQVAKKFHIPMACTKHEDLLDHAKVDAVIVCSPTDTHAQIIKDAAKRGIHVFCEKPIDTQLAVIRDAIQTTKQYGIKFMVGFQRRFDRNFQRVLEARKSGSLGDPLKLTLISRDPAPPPMEYLKQSGGIFLDQAIHDFDMARFLMGEDIVEIYATGFARDPKVAEIGDIDNATCHVKFQSGAIGIIDNARETHYGYDQRAELFGSKGTISIDNDFPNTAHTLSPNGLTSDLPLHFFMERYSNAYLEEMQAFIRCLQENKPVPVGGEEGLIPVVYSEAAKKSFQENRPVLVKEIDPSLP
ncbi:myo-inositol 2-dehydrogenase [Galdieria sulphuraria]|uniref:Myo-inositol 2-dehydrogenase n=1 Tax=Galdieria sulphuraria TaxID=130081 RepID=Q7XYU9_GALSU|nr:myo-inositol 2-dehydrogenase [Galdieria sulphuraria]AAP41844.1 myo-inositol dehydrogenase precursor [Galdieria sulphuraria]EME29848.1 myo-inositol 2-dehydrogenase [Galdieria sulphuraria]|eukprot:XP_005706368.1 myo-inositol 2-dehydrogenase [Galdieria sulphuraria]